MSKDEKAKINPDIPYGLPCLFPTIPQERSSSLSQRKGHAALIAAKKDGLKRVSLGNEHLLK